MDLHWEAPEFEHHEKDVSWFWGSIILAIIVLAIAVWQRNFLFGFFVVIAEILILVWSGREPAILNFELSEKGLTINGENRYTLSEIEAWSIAPDEEAEFRAVKMQVARRFPSSIRVLVTAQILPQVKALLGARLNESEYEETLTETIAKFFRF